MNNVPFIQSPNYSQGRGGLPIKAVCIHTMVGTYNGSIQWFKNPASQASTHFLVSFGGDITQMVKDGDMAWANGIRVGNGEFKTGSGMLLDKSKLAQVVLDNPNANPNLYTISIELEGYPEDAVTQEQYDAVLRILRYVRDTYQIQFTRYNLVGHYQIDHINKPNCPGTRFDFDRVLNQLNGNTQSPAPQPQPAPVNNNVEFYTIKTGGWRSQVIQDIINARIWSGTWQENQPKFDRLNPVTPTAQGWLPGMQVRVKEAAQPEPPKEDPKMIDELKQKLAQDEQKIKEMESADAVEDAAFQKKITDLENMKSTQDQAFISLKELATATANENVVLKKENSELKIKVETLQHDFDSMKVKFDQVIAINAEYKTKIDTQELEIKGLNEAIAAYKSGSSTISIPKETISKIEQIALSKMSWKDKLKLIRSKVKFAFLNALFASIGAVGAYLAAKTQNFTLPETLAAMFGGSTFTHTFLKEVSKALITKGTVIAQGYIQNELASSPKDELMPALVNP